MPWFNVDDGFAFHRKAVMAGNSAIGMWVRAGSWCARELTDGFVPDHMVRTMGTPAQAKRLVACGLWHRDDERGGYQFHEYSDDGRNMTREQVLAQRAYDRRKAALQRDKDLVSAVRARDGDRCRYCGCLVNWGDRRGSVGATYDHVDPNGPNAIGNVVVACRGCNSRKGSRTPSAAGMRLLAPKSMGISPEGAGPDVAYQERSDSEPSSNQNGSGTYQGPLHSPPLPSQEEQKKTSSSSPRKRGTRIPEDFVVTPDMVSWARERVPHVDGRHETEKFINHWSSKSGRDAVKLDWVKTWKNWMLTAAERAPSRASPPHGYQSQTDANIAAFLGVDPQPHLKALPGGAS